MSGTTTAMATSYKAEAMRGLHIITAPVTPTATTTNSSDALTALSSVSGIQTGMNASGGNLAGSTTVVAVTGAATATIYPATNASGAGSGQNITFTGDTIAIALIKNGCAGTYGAASTNYSNVTGNTDEATGTGYSAGGYAWAATSWPAVSTSGTTAYETPSVNPSWTGATLDVQGAIIYNQASRGENTANRAIGVLDFGGEQKVNSGTLTILMPSNTSSTALLRFQ